MPRRAINKPEVVERILSALRVGNTRSAAALYGGIEPETLYRWIARDSQFKHIVEKAEADGEVRHVARIAKAADEGTWQASAWWLERRRPEDWGRRETLKVQGDKEHPIEHRLELAHMTDDELIKRAKSLLDRTDRAEDTGGT